MRNYVQPGDVVRLTAPYAVTSGQGLLVGVTFGVAQHDAANGAGVDTRLEGVFDLTKAAGAIAQGAAVFWDNAARNVTTTAAGNTRIGVATAAAAGGDATVRARLNGSF